MPVLNVDGLTFIFPDHWNVAKYDEWSYYRNRFCRFMRNKKAVDLLAIAPDGVLFLIEAKDYRVHARTKVIGLVDEFAQKVLDTLAAMLPCRVNGDDQAETDFSQSVLNAQGLRVVLHLEQPAKHSKLFPRAFDPADIKMKLRQQMKPIDAHPMVVESATLGLSWQVY